MSDEAEALIHPGDDGKFWAEVIGLNGCYAQGDNYTQIMGALRDAHELCSAHPSASTPPPAELTLPENPTIGDLISTLATHGWERTANTSPAHTLHQHTANGASLALPTKEAQPLNAGYRSAIERYLGSS